MTYSTLCCSLDLRHLHWFKELIQIKLIQLWHFHLSFFKLKCCEVGLFHGARRGRLWQCCGWSLDL